MEILKRFIKYWWTNFCHAFHGAERVFHGALFLVAIVGTIWPHVFHDHETITLIVEKSSIVIVLAYLLWIPFHRHEEKEKEFDQQKRDTDDALERKAKEMQQQRGNADNEIAKLNHQLQLLKNSTPCFLVNWFPHPPCLVTKVEGTYCCLLEVTNTSKTATAHNVKMVLISVHSTMPNPQLNNLAALNLSCKDVENIINPESRLYFELFLLNCTPFHRTVSITDSQKSNYQFEARQIGADMLSETNLSRKMLTFHSYTLEIKVSATGCSPITQKFTLNFPLNEPFVDLTLVN
jgi:hypothetical protein